MAKHPADYELDFLHNCTNEELEPLVAAILGTVEKKDPSGKPIRGSNGEVEKEIDRSGRFSSKLDTKEIFRRNFPNHSAYVDDIIEELQLYGGHSLINPLRGYGVMYHEILVDAAGKMKVHFKAEQRTVEIEVQLLAKVLKDVWEKLSDDERSKVLSEAASKGADVGGVMGAAGVGGLIALINAGGFTSYQIMLAVINSIARILLGRGLMIGANAAAAKVMAVFAGPVGWMLAGLWAACDVGSTAYRVTIPAAIYIAALRRMKETQRDHPEFVS